MEKFIDCRGMACPLPVVTAKKSFEEFSESGILEVLVDNEIAVSNLLKLASSSGFSAASSKKSDAEFLVRIEVEEIKSTGVETDSKTTTVVISSNKMGSGDEELGKNLMKAFIFTLNTLENLPSDILFYNSGAFLVAEGSPCIEDLKKLEQSGVKIRVCGACINFYGLEEKLAVGEVSNMYDILNIMSASDKIIRP